jgi:hypothetical protein
MNGLDRRAFVAGSVALLAAPLAAEAQRGPSRPHASAFWAIRIPRPTALC